MEYYSDDSYDSSDWRDVQWRTRQEEEAKAARHFYKAIEEALNTLAKQPGFLEMLFKCSEDPGEIVLEMQRQAAKTHREFAEKYGIIAAKYASDDELMRLAESEETSPNVLALLAKCDDWVLRSKVARNPNGTREVLEKLAEDENKSVRAYAKEHLTKM